MYIVISSKVACCLTPRNRSIPCVVHGTVQYAIDWVILDERDLERARIPLVLYSRRSLEWSGPGRQSAGLRQFLRTVDYTK